MSNRLGSGKSNDKAPTTDLHSGLKDRAAKWPDRSTKMSGGSSVNSDTTRQTTAPTPKTLGPRVA